MIFSGLSFAAALVVFLSVPAQSHVEENSRAANRGKAEDFARGDLEFRLPSSKLRSYSLQNFFDYKYVMLVGASSKVCTSGHFDRAVEKIQNAFSDTKLMRVLLIDSNPSPHRERIAEKPRSYVYLFDSLQQVSPSFGFMKTGDFVIMNPATNGIVSRGNLADLNGPRITRELPTAIAAAWPKLDSKNGVVKSVGCALDYAPASKLDFKTGFLQPFSRACQNCHVRTEVYDQFLTLDQTLGWRAMSLRSIRLQRMPGGYDPYYRSKHESQLASMEDIRRVVQWLSNPGPVTAEKRALFLAERERIKAKMNSSGFNGPVLFVANLPEKIQLTAEGSLLYRNAFLGEPLKEDLVIQGVRLETNLSAVHHANIIAFPPGMITRQNFLQKPTMNTTSFESNLERTYGSDSFTKISGRLDGRQTEFMLINEPVLTTFSRRAGTQAFANGSAFFLPKGTQIAIQLHIQPSGKNEEIDAHVELLGRNASGPYGKLKRISFNPGSQFTLEPNRDSYVSTVARTFDHRIRLHSLWIHTHYRGAAARISLQDPNGNKRTIASLPFIQMKMNGARFFGNGGLPIEAGSSLITEIEYDNSVGNSANPDPDALIKLGGATLENEMHFPRFVYVDD